MPVAGAIAGGNFVRHDETADGNLGVGAVLNDVSDKSGIIYILINDAMPNMVKIGRTSGDGVERRVAELSRATGVPLPFKVVVARAVSDSPALEKALHIAFGPDRVNPAREFFNIAPERAIAIINAFPGQDLTPQTERAVETAVEAAEPGVLAAANAFARKRRPPQNFVEMGIPVGSILVHGGSGETCEVVEARKVRFRGEITSLTRALQLILASDTPIQPGRHWMFNGESVEAIYNATYPLAPDPE